MLWPAVGPTLGQRVRVVRYYTYKLATGNTSIHARLFDIYSKLKI